MLEDSPWCGVPLSAAQGVAFSVAAAHKARSTGWSAPAAGAGLPSPLGELDPVQHQRLDLRPLGRVRQHRLASRPVDLHQCERSPQPRHRLGATARHLVVAAQQQRRRRRQRRQRQQMELELELELELEQQNPGGGGGGGSPIMMMLLPGLGMGLEWVATLKR